MALIFDEYDAGRPDVMFVIQRILERDGKMTLLDQNRVISPHPYFRLFATANTLGQGNLNGMYHGAQRLNHAQIDRWNIVATLNYLPRDEEVAIVLARVPGKDYEKGRKLIGQMVALADLTRKGFAAGDLSTLMSPRTVITWAENCEIFRDPALAFRLSFLNKCDDAERPIVAEYFQRCFDMELEESLQHPTGALGVNSPTPATPAATRAQQRIEELCAASIRAISGERDLYFRSRRLHRGNRALPLFGPHLQPSLEHDDFASFRGAADGIALRLRWSDADLHRSLCPADPVERWVFELLEQCRVEAMAGVDMPGIAHNLQHRFEAWSADFHHSRLTETSRGMLLYTVAQVARSWVSGTRVMEETEDLIESTRISLSPLIGTALAGLRRARLDQQAYAVFALDIAERIADRLRIGDDPASAAAQADDEADDSSR